jgi:DNA replication protein DnaC
VNLELERIALHASRLNLHTVADAAPLLAEDAAKNNQSYIEFLEKVLRSEAEAADSRATDMIMKTASFPFLRTLEDFDFGFQASVSRKQVRELASCAFIERKENPSSWALRGWARATWRWPWASKRPSGA